MQTTMPNIAPPRWSLSFRVFMALPFCDNGNHHRVAAKKVTTSSAVDRPLRCMVLFWLFFRTRTQHGGTRTRLTHRWILPSHPARCTGFVSRSRSDGRMGIGITTCGVRRCSRCIISGIDVPTYRSSTSTSTSTVRCDGLSTSTMGSDCLRARTMDYAPTT